jgi:hypothetical protein
LISKVVVVASWVKYILLLTLIIVRRDKSSPAAGHVLISVGADDGSSSLGSNPSIIQIQVGILDYLLSFVV